MSYEDIFDVFLSHSHLDAGLVEGLAQQLEDYAKLHVWLDKWVLVPGERWQQAMTRGLDQAKSCAVCIGQQTPMGWFREEIERALNRQVEDPSFRVIPVLLPDANTANVDNFLELRTWVDFRNGLHDKKSLHVLVCGIQGVAPGRGPLDEDVPDSMHVRVRQKLMQLRQLRSEQLVDEIIVLEYQRRLLDRLLGS